ncbi:MAG: hypothetical protein ACR2RA_17130 [Geminicoccaceae bacterium]
MTIRLKGPLLGVRLGVVLTLLYLPILSVVLASLANTRYMRFPHKVLTLDAYREALGAFDTKQLHLTSLKIASVVVLLATIMVSPAPWRSCAKTDVDGACFKTSSSCRSSFRSPSSASPSF